MPIRYRIWRSALQPGRPETSPPESESSIEGLVKALKATPETLSSDWDLIGRDQGMTKAFRTGAYTLTKIMRHLGIHQSTATRIVRRQGNA